MRSDFSLWSWHSFSSLCYESGYPVFFFDTR